MIGQTLGHYQILEKLGAGGMGEVYRARDTTLDREVALKILPASLAESQEQLARFQREAKVLAALDHPNIVTVFSVESVDGVHFLTMQLVEGQRLSEVIPEGGMGLERLLDIAIPLTEALTAAHHKGVTHRDLKPANIMLSGDGRVKVLDFGLAKLRPETDRAVASELSTEPYTGEGRILGTVPYMSPEQARGEELDSRTDLFSLGAVLYEMATGCRTFTGSTPAVIFDAILHQRHSSLVRHNPDLPDELEHIVDKALEKDRDLRYHSADELLADLRRLSRDTVSTASAAVSPQQEERPRRRPWLWAAAAAVLLLLVTGVYWSSRRSQSAREATSAAVGEDLERSIAVLPFENLSGDPEQTYFSDGLTIEMIAQLSKISSLDKVIAFNSSRRYRDSEKSLHDIGEELDAALLLEGTVRQQGDRVRVTAQLINASEEGQIWAETYDGEMSDIFAVQSQIAGQIGTALRLELSPEVKAQIEQRPTENLTAYNFYLKGQDFRVRYNKEANESAIDFYRAALELDPEFAQARAGLAYATALQGYLYGGEARWLETAVEEAKKALDLDPNLSDANVALAATYTIRGWNEQAEREARAAIELSPNSDRGSVELGWIYLSSGRWDEAYPLFRKALELNPLHAYNYWSLGSLYLGLSDFTRAEAWARKALELQPDDTMAHFLLWPALWAQGRVEEATEISQRMLALSPDDPKSHMATAFSALIGGDLELARRHFVRAFELAPDTLLGDFRIATSLGAFLWQIGDRAEAGPLLARSLALNEQELAAGNQSPRPLTDMARIYVTKGDNEEALSWLRRAVDAGYIAIDHPVWTSLFAETEYQQMKTEVDARVAEMRQRIAAMEREWGPESSFTAIESAGVQ